MSLRLRLVIGISIVIAISLGLLGFAVVKSTRDDLQGAATRQLERSLSNRSNANRRPPSAPGARPDPRGLVTAHLALNDQNQIVIAEPAGPPSDPLPLPKLTDAEVTRLRDGKSVTVDSVDGTLRYLVLAGPSDDGRLDVEAAPLNGIDNTMSSLITRFLVGALVMLLLAAAAVMLVVSHGLRPLRKVINTADAVAAGERDQRIPTDEGPSEIRHLSVALDRMLQQQRASLIEREESELRLRRFISDASHELQTPITSVLGWTELQRKGALDADGAAMAMSRIESESRRMSVLVDDLLLLARLDEHRPLQQLSVDLAAIAQDAVIDAQAVEPHRQITCDAPTSAMVSGDPARLRQVVDNLLRNVRVHTPAAAPAVVIVRANDTHARLIVDDNGPGIDPQNLALVFDRFWRRDPSRTRATGGAGLGLAIVSALVEAHHGTVTASEGETGGARFTITLPLVATAQSPQ